jgi:SAM-dependent methyltransferase
MTLSGKRALVTGASTDIGAAIPYILGHSESELHRLMRQAAVLAPITRRLFSDAGLARDMRVLDVGCGTGDVSILAAEMVGSGGAVVGIDRSKDALACPILLPSSALSLKMFGPAAWWRFTR